MQPNQSEFTAEASMQTIHAMIATAKQSFQKINFYFLLWGILMSTAGLAEFMLAINGYQYPYIVWPFAGIIGGIVAGIHGAKQGKTSTVSTFMDKVVAFLWGSYTVTLILVIVGAVVAGQQPSPFVLLLTGLPTFVTGALIGFRALMAGGIVFWCFGIACFWLPPVYGSLMFSIAIAIGYVFPGIMLKRNNL